MPEMKEVMSPEGEKARARLPELVEEADSAPDNMVFVLDFGLIESQGINHVEYAEDMYENGNKIGIMG